MPKQPQKRTLLERAADMMDLPADTVAGVPRMEILGNKQFYLSNHKGLLTYDDDLIAINCGKVIVRVRGQNLGIKAMNVEDIMVEGVILSVEFEG